jgi:hypothetical protein
VVAHRLPHRPFGGDPVTRLGSTTSWSRPSAAIWAC